MLMDAGAVLFCNCLKVLDMVCFSVNIETYKAVFKKWKGAINLDKNAIIVEPIKK